jgi:hypothetical protein
MSWAKIRLGLEAASDSRLIGSDDEGEAAFGESGGHLEDTLDEAAFRDAVEMARMEVDDPVEVEEETTPPPPASIAMPYPYPMVRDKARLARRHSRPIQGRPRPRWRDRAAALGARRLGRDAVLQRARARRAGLDRKEVVDLTLAVIAINVSGAYSAPSVGDDGWRSS